MALTLAMGACVAFVGLSNALAQVPSVLEPALIEQSLGAGPQLKAQPRISVPASGDNQAPEGAKGITFVFGGVRIEGANALPQSELVAAFPHAVGDTVEVADIYVFADAVSAIYRNAGYALSFAVVPPQEIEGGVFRIEVVEGFVERVEIEGVESDTVRAHIERVAGNIEASRPLRVADLERYMLLINDLSGVTVSGTISPAEVAAGAVLTLAVQHQPVAGSVGYNSFLPDALGRHVVEVGGEVRGVVTGSDRISLSVKRSATSNAYLSISGAASTAVGSDGLRAGISGSWTSTDPVDELLDSLEYRGQSLSVRLFGEYPVIRSREQNLWLGASFGIDNSNSTVLGSSFSDDRLRALSLWGSYDFVDATSAVTSVKGTLTQGLDVFGSQGDSRSDGAVGYTKVELDAQRNQPLGVFYDGLLSVQLAAHGQVTLGSGGLFSSAECSFGGRRFGKGFDAGAQTGEHCLQGSAELHWARPVQVLDLPDPMLFDFYTFLDGGVVWQRNSPRPGQVSAGHAVSYGLGLNVEFTPEASGLIEVSRQGALWDGAGLSLDGPSGATRVVGSLSVKF